MEQEVPDVRVLMGLLKLFQETDERLVMYSTLSDVIYSAKEKNKKWPLELIQNMINDSEKDFSVQDLKDTLLVELFSHVDIKIMSKIKTMDVSTTQSVVIDSIIKNLSFDLVEPESKSQFIDDVKT